MIVSLAAHRNTKRRRTAMQRRYRVGWHRAASYHINRLAQYRRDEMRSLVAEWHPDLYYSRVAYRHIVAE